MRHIEVFSFIDTRGYRHSLCEDTKCYCPGCFKAILEWQAEHMDYYCNYCNERYSDSALNEFAPYLWIIEKVKGNLGKKA